MRTFDGRKMFNVPLKTLPFADDLLLFGDAEDDMQRYLFTSKSMIESNSDQQTNKGCC